MEKGKLDVAVIGGGSAGLATAIALMTMAQRERLNIKVTVFDKPSDSKTDRPDPRAIELWRNAYDALSRINTGKPLSETDDTHFFGKVGYALERYDFRSTNGSVLWSLPAGAIGRKMQAKPTVVTLQQIRQRLQDRWDKIVVGIPVIEESLKAWKGLDVLLDGAIAAGDETFVTAVQAARTALTSLRDGHLTHQLRRDFRANPPAPEPNHGRRAIVVDRFYNVLQAELKKLEEPLLAEWIKLSPPTKVVVSASRVPDDYQPKDPDRLINWVKAGLHKAAKLEDVNAEKSRRAAVGAAAPSDTDLEPTGHDIISDNVTEVLWSPEDSVALIGTSPPDPRDPKSKATLKFDLVIGTDSRSSVVYRDARLWSEYRDHGERLFGDPKHARARSSVMAIAGVAGLNEAEAATARDGGQTVRVPGRDLVEPGVGFVIHGPNVRLGAWPCPEAPDSATRWLLFVSRDAIFPLVQDGTGPHGGEDARDSMIHAANKRFATATGDTVVKKVRDHIDDTLKPLPKTARDLVKNTATNRISLYPLEDRRSNKAHWVAGRVMLLGDAAHPSLPDLGQACAMAFEDAAALAVWIRKLAYEDAELPKQNPEGEARLIRALCGWRDERFPRVAKIVEATRIASEAAHSGTHVSETMRDLAIAYLGPAVIGAGVESWVNPHGAR